MAFCRVVDASGDALANYLRGMSPCEVELLLFGTAL